MSGHRKQPQEAPKWPNVELFENQKQNTKGK